MPLPGGAVREARSGNVHEASGSKERGRKGRDGGVANTSLERQKEGERRRGGWGGERKRSKRGRK